MLHIYTDLSRCRGTRLFWSFVYQALTVVRWNIRSVKVRTHGDGIIIPLVISCEADATKSLDHAIAAEFTRSPVHHICLLEDVAGRCGRATHRLQSGE